MNQLQSQGFSGASRPLDRSDCDVTNSQPLKRYEISAAVANQLLPGLSPGDRVRIGVLATPLTLSAWLPSDPRISAGLVRPLIERAGAEPSPLWDATHVAIEALAGEPAPKMIAILSDGRSNAVSGLDDVADRARPPAAIASSVKVASGCWRKAPMPRRGYDPMPLSSGSRIKPAACSCPTEWPDGPCVRSRTPLHTFES